MKTAHSQKARHEQLMRTEMIARSVFGGQFDHSERAVPLESRSMLGELVAQVWQSRIVRQARAIAS